jgi:CHAT domain-containing protein/Tfp pilus assembly protein PilF
MEVDSPNGDSGPEEVYLIADTSGTYRVDVRSLEKGASGKYAATLKEKRVATTADQELVANLALAKEAKGLIDQADSLRANGQYGEGIRKAERGLMLFEKALGLEHLEVGNALNSLGLLYEFSGDYTRAEKVFLRAQAIFEKILGAEHPAVAAVLQNLAGVADAKGDFTREEELLRRSSETYEKALGKQHPQVGISLNLLGRHYYNKGQYPKAEQLYDRALAIEEKALGPDHPEIAFVVHNLAELYQAEGDYPRAESLFRRALTIREKALGPEHPDLAYTLHNLAEVYSDQGDYAQSEALHRRALAIREKALGQEHPDVANSLNSLGLMYFAKGDYAQAEIFMRRGLAIYEKTFGKEHREVATGLDNLGSVYREKGDYAEAQALHQRALAIYENILGPEHPNVAITLNHLALAFDATGDYGRAVEYLARGQEVREHNLRLVLTAGSERQKQLYIDTLSVQTDYAISLHQRFAPTNERAAQLALTTILQRKGRSLDAMTDHIATLRQRAAPQDQILFDQLATALSYLATLEVFSEGKLMEARREDIAKTRASVETLQKEISRRSSEFRSDSLPITLQAVQQAIPADAVLVEFFSYQPFNVKAKEGARLGAPRYVSYVLRRDSPTPQFVDLGELPPIDGAVQRWRAALRNPRSADVNDLAREVYGRVMKRVSGLIGEKRRIFLAPDGALNLIPFAALVDEKGNYLIKKYSFTYLTSGRDLLRLEGEAKSRGAAVVMANPLYDMNRPQEPIRPADQAPIGNDQNQRASLDALFLNLKPLPGTAAEAAALAKLMPDAQVLTLAKATEAALKGVNRPRILHIATHGFFLPDQRQTPLERDRSLLGRSNKSLTPPHWENPLLRSGLVLAGVKQRHSGDGEDGVLTSLEVAGLNLWGTKLVVLSACETGLGAVRSGEGVYGLRRALVLAGSEAQVISLWKVSDAGTRDLMTAYYTRLRMGEGRTEALRQVQFAMLRGQLRASANSERRATSDTGEKVATRDYRHPYYWAAFIQSGDWRNLDGR